MMRNFFIAGVMVSCVLTGWAQTVGEPAGVTVDATWVTKYIWRGFDVLDDVAAFQPSVAVQIPQTSLSFKIWASFPGSSGTTRGGSSRVNLEQWNYSLTHTSSAYEGQVYKTDCALTYIYYDYPDMASKDADLQEYNIMLSWPDLCPTGVVPSYTFIQMWPSKGDGLVRDYSGFIHVVGLSYDYICADMPEMPFTLMWNAVYNDGTGGSTVDHDWSHMLWGISTSLQCPAGGKFTPALYYQTSMEDSVNPEDEFWMGISYSMTF